MVRALSARARDIAWRIQQVAYVENLVPRSGVEFLRGADQPIAPSCTRSQTAKPWPTRMSNARVLLVANHTVSNRPLVEAVRLRAAVPPVAFHLVVPGTRARIPPRGGSGGGRHRHREGAASRGASDPQRRRRSGGNRDGSRRGPPRRSQDTPNLG